MVAWESLVESRGAAERLDLARFMFSLLSDRFTDEREQPRRRRRLARRRRAAG